MPTPMRLWNLKISSPTTKAGSFLAYKDADLAAELHPEDIQAAQHAKEVEQMEMSSTTTGKATLFVEKILEAHDICSAFLLFRYSTVIPEITKSLAETSSSDVSFWELPSKSQTSNGLY
jgi:hypothetical protein